MPHLIVEYSNNVVDDVLDIDALLEKLAAAAVATGLFPEAGLRARAYRAEQQRVADGDPDKGFVHVAMNVGRGRELAERQAAGEQIFAALKVHLESLMAERPITLSFEMREIDPVKFNYRNF